VELEIHSEAKIGSMLGVLVVFFFGGWRSFNPRFPLSKFFAQGIKDSIWWNYNDVSTISPKMTITLFQHVSAWWIAVTSEMLWDPAVWSPKTSHEWYIVMCISHWGRWLWHCGYCGSWQLYHIISSHIRTIPIVISNLRSFSSLISILNGPIWIKGANAHWVLKTVIRPSRGHPKKTVDGEIPFHHRISNPTLKVPILSPLTCIL
jgi:hypothetical protein